MQHIIIHEQKVFRLIIPAEQEDATLPIVRYIPGDLQRLILLQELMFSPADEVIIVHPVHPERIRPATVSQGHIVVPHIMNQAQVLPEKVHPDPMALQ